MKFLFSKAAESESSRKIFRATLTVAAFTVVAKTGATIKELIVARWFGRSDALDAFLIAYLLPAFVLSLVMGAFMSALVPAFIRVRETQGLPAAQKLFSSMMFLKVIVLLGIIVLLGLLAPYYLPLLGSNFPAAKLRLTRELLYVLLPFILCGGLTACASAILNAGEKFALPALTPLMTPLITILFLEFGPRNWGSFLLAGGVVGGSLLEATLVLQMLKMSSIRPSLKWSGFDPDVRSVLEQWTPMLAAAFLAAATSVVDQSMAAMLPPGSVSALNYANKILSVVLAIGGTAVCTAALPYFSQMVAKNNWAGCRHTLKHYSILVFSCATPVTLVLMIFSKPLVRLLFQRGAFTAADTELVSWVQVCYVIQVPFYILSTLYARFLASMRRNRMMMLSAGISLSLDIALNLGLMKIWGVAGIALSTSLFYVVASLFLGTYSFRLLTKQQLAALAVLPEDTVIH